MCHVADTTSTMSRSEEGSENCHGRGRIARKVKVKGLGYKELIINWDQTGVHYMPVSNWTMEKKGTKRVKVFGAEDK